MHFIIHFATWLSVEVLRSLIIYIPLHLILYILLRVTNPARHLIKTEEHRLRHQHHRMGHKTRWHKCAEGECATKQNLSESRLEQVSADLGQSL